MFKLVVLSCLVAAARASGLLGYAGYAGYAGFGGIAPLAYPAPLAYSAPLIGASNYRGPLSLAPGQPANILAADGRPLDTLDVNLDRSAHLTAKALSGVHYLKKRSAPLFAAPLINRVALGHSSLIAPAPLAYTAPLAHTYAAPLAHTYASPLTYGAPLIHY